MDYDATACYDRIITPLWSLISRAFGLHRSIVVINATTLEEAKYVLKTKLGISEAHYKYQKIFPIMALDKGTGTHLAYGV